VTVPNFFIVGAPKAGTTSLHAYLDQHDQIYMSPLKEPYFFSTEVRAENFTDEERPRIERDLHALQEYLHGDMSEPRFGGLVSEWNDYLKLFHRASGEIAVGESTPHYLWSESAPRNIAAKVPNARIIISLRNPIDRAYSDYLHIITDRAIQRSFREHINANLQCAEKRIGLSWPFLEYGHYTGQIRRYFDHFPRSQIHICFYDDLQRAPQQLMSQLYGFLGVDPQFNADLSRRHNEPRIPRYLRTTRVLKKLGVWPHLGRLAPQALRSRMGARMFQPRAALQMEPADRVFLTEYYRDEINSLSQLLERDLTPWLRAAP
jgi:hypothetical protein